MTAEDRADRVFGGGTGADGEGRPFRSGIVALAGRPNVGKSTLANRLVGRKVSIVSSKPQTTRHRIQAVVNGDGWQLVLLDIPGFQKPRDPLTQRMQKRVEEALEEVDAVLFVVDATQPVGRGDAFIAAHLAGGGTTALLALNKTDLVSGDQLRRQEDDARSLGDFGEPLPVGALTGAGLADLTQKLVSLLPEGPRYFPEDVVTDQPEELLMEELIREKAIAVTEDEVPHSLAVQVLDVEPREKKGMLYVRAAIYVERESQRPIILGEGGSRIKKIGSEARREMEALLGTHIYLDLGVKVKKGWRRDPSLLERFGL
jgi:GTPase